MTIYADDGPPDTERPLTATELLVLRLTARGPSTAEIGAELGLCMAEAREHLQAASRALGAGSRIEALIRAARTGLLRPRS